MMQLSTHWTGTRRRLGGLVRAVVARSRVARSEAGDTLIEVLLALIILSLASVALITAFETDISASAEHRNLANFDTALANSLAMTSSVIQEGYTSVFTACPVPSTSLAAYPSESVLTTALAINGFTAQIAASGTQPAIEYSGGTTFTTACTNPSANSTGNVGQPQLINVVVTNSATGISQSDTVIVVDPTPVQAGGSNSNQASQLEFSTQPEGATVSQPFTTQPVIEVLDSNGNIVTSNLSSITISLDPALGTPGATLSSCTGQETSGIVVFSGCSINEAGIGYELEAVEGSGTSQLTKYSAPFSVYSAQLATPTITNVAPSTLAGALTVTFTSPPNSQAFTAKACTDMAMSLNCVTAASITSGGSITGLTQGTSYYVQVTATATGSYLASTTPPYTPAVMATVQLVAPSGVSATAGTVAGSLAVSFTPTTPIATNQEYTVAACTNSAMSQNCVTNTNYTPGSNITGLKYTAGSSIPSYYYVDVLANGSPGYLVSMPSAPAVESSAVESAVITPSGFSASPSASQMGSITAVFTESGAVLPSSFTATVCTNSAMTAGCLTVPNYTSNSQISGLTPGSSYYVTITAVSTTPGYASATTAVSTATMATVQLVSPTGLSANYGPAAGTIAFSLTPPLGAPSGQTYTVLACTNSGMTGAGCVTNAAYVNGNNLTGLAYTPGSPGATYYIEATANPTSGYLVSPASSQVSQADTSQLLAPTAVSANYGTAAGSIQVNFTPPTTVAAGQTYTLDACTNKNMTGCQTNANYVAGSNDTLPFTQGAVGTTYYVEVLSNASAAYVASGYSAQASHAQMSEVDTPTIARTQTGTGTGDISITFSEGGTAPTSFTALACPNIGMTGAGCVTKAGYISATQFTGLVSGTTYYVTITAIGPTGYLNSTSAVSTAVKAR